MRRTTILLVLVAQFLPLDVTTANAQAAGEDGSALDCDRPGPGFLVRADGLKDRSGRVIVELYPANEADFLKDKDELLRERKQFQRVEAFVPARGTVKLCIRAPKPGPYALVFIHDRDGKDKFNIWRDGIGLPSEKTLGSTRPRVTEARVVAGTTITPIAVRLQYIRGLSGFSPTRQ